MTIPNPYVGPRAFRTGEKIYGRDMELRDLLDLLIAERIVLLYSPSGAGKTSLIHAGLVPRLQAEGFSVLPTVRVNLEPPASLASDMPFNRYLLSVLLSLEEALSEEQRLPLDKLAGMSLDEYLEQFPKENEAPDSQVLIFDQVEEILSLIPTDQQAKAEFFSQVGEALRNRKRWALFSMREDYVAALDPYVRAVPTRLRNTYRLDRLEVRAARQAIKQPASDAGVDFQDTAAQILVDDLRRVRVQMPDGSVEQQLGLYVEPVQLQVVCYRLWSNRDTNRAQILEADVKAIGDVNTALADYYAERVVDTAQATKVSQRLIRDWFDHQLITEQGIRSQVLMGAEKSGGLDNRAIRRLENAHLVRAEKRGGATWFELAHDRLIEPVRQDNLIWMQKNLSLLQRSAEVWNRQERPDSLLLREKDLNQAEAWAGEHQDELLPHEVDFLEASQEACEKEQQARAMAEQAIQLEAERKRAELQARLTRIISAVGVLAILLAITAAVLAFQSNENAIIARNQSTQAVANARTAQANEGTARAASTEAFNQKEIADAARLTEAAARETAVFDRATAQAASTEAVAQQEIAQTNANVAQSRRMASLGLIYLSQQPVLSMLFNVEAYQTAPTFEALSALFTGLQRSLNRRIELFGRQPPMQSPRLYTVAFSPDGSKIAWGGTNGLIALWDVQEQRLIRSRLAHGLKTVYQVSFSPRGDILATGGGDGTISLWDPDNLDPVREFRTQHSFVLSLAFSPDGNTLASSGIGKNISLWDVPNNRFLRTLSPPIGDDVWSVSWSPDGEFLASGGADGLVRIWDPETGNELESFEELAGTIYGLAWSPDSQRLAIGGDNQSTQKEKNLFIWDIASRSATSLVGHTDRVRSLAFTADGDTLASGGDDRKIYLWDVSNQEQINQISDRSHWIMGLAFNPRGKQLLAGVGFDREIKIYEVITEQPLSIVLTNNKPGISGLVFNADASLIIAGNQGGRVTIWDTEVNNPENSPSQNPQGDYAIVALSHDGSRLALAGQDGDIEVMDTTTGELINQITSPVGLPSSMALSPNNQILAAGVCVQREEELGICTQNDVDLWDIESGAYLGQIHTTHTDEITSLAFSPDGFSLASGSRDHTILLWNVEMGQEFAPSGPNLSGHLGEITSLTFSPDGSMLASGDASSQLMLWDLTTYQPIGQPTSFSIGALGGLAFSADGGQLAIGTQDGTVLMMDSDPLSWMNRACELASRNFSSAEWSQFFPDQSYHQTCPQFPLETPTPTPNP